MNAALVHLCDRGRLLAIAGIKVWWNFWEKLRNCAHGELLHPSLQSYLISIKIKKKKERQGSSPGPGPGPWNKAAERRGTEEAGFPPAVSTRCSGCGVILLHRKGQVMIWLCNLWSYHRAVFHSRLTAELAEEPHELSAHEKSVSKNSVNVGAWCGIRSTNVYYF